MRSAPSTFPDPATVPIMSKRVLIPLLATILGLMLAAPALAQTDTAPTAQPETAPTNCGTYEGVVCHGRFSDDADIATDDSAIEALAAAGGTLNTADSNKCMIIRYDEEGVRQEIAFDFKKMLMGEEPDLFAEIS